jgi:hypothetical protein
MTSKKTTKTTKTPGASKNKSASTKAVESEAKAEARDAQKVKVRRVRRVLLTVDWKTAKDRLFWDMQELFRLSATLHKDLDLFNKAKKTEHLDFLNGKISKNKVYRDVGVPRSRRLEDPKFLRKCAKNFRASADRLETKAAKLEAKKP